MLKGLALYFKQRFCKHIESSESVQCPWSGNTYYYCKKCDVRVRVERPANA